MEFWVSPLEDMVSELAPEHWVDRRVLLTGATGLLGGWMLDRLVRLGADPVCLVRDRVPRAQSNSSGLLEQVTSVGGQLEDYAVLERTINEYEIDCVLHLAAQTIVETANRSPISTFETNIRGTWNLLEACRRVGGVRAIVIASSDKAYGDAVNLPYQEDQPLSARFPYDVSKSCTDMIAKSYFATYSLPVAITRCGNFYGGGDLNFNRLVPGTIRSILRGKRPEIRSDGASRRDYVYIKDAVEAYLLLAQRLEGDQTLHGEAFNFSNEDPKTVLEIVDAILAQMGRIELDPVIQGRARHEIRHQYLSAAKARTWLGWSPKYTLAEGLAETIEWYRGFLVMA